MAYERADCACKDNIQQSHGSIAPQWEHSADIDALTDALDSARRVAVRQLGRIIRAWDGGSAVERLLLRDAEDADIKILTFYMDAAAKFLHRIPTLPLCPPSSLQQYLISK